MDSGDKTISSLERLLRELGLSSYESKALAYLVLSREQVKASDLSKATGIPRTKVYAVLESLEDLGLVKVTPTRPLKASSPPLDLLPTLLFEMVLEEALRKLSLLNKMFKVEFSEGLWILGEITLPVEGRDTLKRVSNILLRDSKDFLILITNEESVELVPPGLRYRNISLIVDSPDTYEKLRSKGLRTRNIRIANLELFAFVTEKSGLVSDENTTNGFISTDPGLVKALTVLLRALYLTSPAFK
ncbi:MAG: helix-turn-helix domain-containing protein [Candidatus Korarchaeota archaeon]|nr:helix-turn-helix domain-containing protein [Candidatus Korarchaeota archaeon]